MPAPCEATSDGDLAGNIRYQEEQWWLGSAQNRGQNPNRCEFDLNPVQGWGDERNGPAVRRDAEIAETVRTTYETGRNLHHSNPVCLVILDQHMRLCHTSACDIVHRLA